MMAAGIGLVRHGERTRAAKTAPLPTGSSTSVQNAGARSRHHQHVPANRRRVFFLRWTATVLAILAVVASPLALAMVLLMPLGVALNGTSSVLYGTVAEFVRDDRQGRTFGLFYTLGSAAGATAPFVFGIVSDFAGVPTALMLVAGLAVTTVPIALLLGPHIDRGEGA